ncbi:MAG: hypothetical protein IKA02_00035 [Clostridia bacterium]|nr:hypothetical protein [Clostridia bacterium]
MYREIIELLPSKDLKNKIYEVNHKFTSRELLQIIQNYGRNFNEKQRLWNYVFENETEEKELIETYIRYQNSLLDRLYSDGKYYVYIGGYNYTDYKEYYLGSIQECMSAINYFLDEHYERPPKNITIEKFRDEDDENGSLYGKYQLKCVLNEHGEIVSLIENAPKDFDCKYKCMQCGFQCKHPFLNVFYPSFVNSGEVVRYYENRKINYGVCVIALHGNTQFYHVVDLHSPVIKDHTYDMEEEFTFAVPLPLVEKASFDELSDEEKQDYYDFMNYVSSDNDEDDEN